MFINSLISSGKYITSFKPSEIQNFVSRVDLWAPVTDK